VKLTHNNNDIKKIYNETSRDDNKH